MSNRRWVNAKKAGQKIESQSQANEVKQEPPCCGRSYNEEKDFSQINFEAFQQIIDQRNQLLSGTKPQSLPY